MLAPGAWGLWGGEPFGVPQRGTAYQPVVKPRVCSTTGASSRNAASTRGSKLFCGGRVPGLALGVSRGWGLSRDRSCARRERWGRLGYRAVARGGSGCRRSYARSGPVPLPLGCLGACPSMGW